MSSSQPTDLATAAPPDLVAPFKRAWFYNGISDDPPHLLYRFDLSTSPYSIPKPPFGHTTLPENTVHAAFDATLTPTVWRSTVAPAIITLLKEPERAIHLSSLMAVHFSTVIPYEDELPVFGPTVIWISVHPGTTTAIACRDASPDILSLLGAHGVQGAPGSVEQLSGPPMMRVVDDTDPTSYVRRALMPVLGLPLAAAVEEEEGDDDSQGGGSRSGSLAFFFHEGEDKGGNPSEKVLGITTKHAIFARKNVQANANVDSSELSGYTGGAAKADISVRACSSRRFQAMVNKTQKLIDTNTFDAELLPRRIAGLESKPKPTTTTAAEDDTYVLKWRKLELERVKEDKVDLEKFLKDLDANWRDPTQRTIGVVDWAPEIRSDVDAHGYTQDIATFALDESKWKKEFKGNVLTFYFTVTGNRPSFKYPINDLFKIQGFVPAERLANPYFPTSPQEENTAAFTVAKSGQSSNLTFGRYSPMEAYTCSTSGEHGSWEIPIFNYDRRLDGLSFIGDTRLGEFSAKGDSGSLVFNARGEMVALLHSGIITRRKEERFGGVTVSSHVGFATPAHFVVEQIKRRYPKADFTRQEF
ncbi:hypothetical protein FA13DRAFT_1758804 [Coprinellus micaceus]|uniref:Peptidase S64 n=1 Tax=Coprinellus micaceus TaxID=71717 RepID=A0A4Y7S9S4_COPMI|nr:hypothetical protein FA13DRAFT_1758804 [Coprinellus micaceus]